MLNGPKEIEDSKPVRLDVNFVSPRVNDRRKKILGAMWIDNKHEINKQIADLSCYEICDLINLFQCNVNQLAECIKLFKESTKF